MSKQRVLELLAVGLVTLVLNHSRGWYRPAALKEGRQLRCSYAPIRQQMLTLLSLGILPLFPVLWYHSNWRTLSPLGRGLVVTLVPLLVGLLWTLTIESWVRRIEIDEGGLRVRRLLGRRLVVPWTRVSRLVRKPFWDAFQVVLDDGKSFMVPDELVGRAEILTCIVQQLPIERYHSGHRALDRVIQRLRAEVQRAVQRAQAQGLGAIGAPDEAVATLVLTMPQILQRGLLEYYASPAGELAGRVPDTLTLVAAAAHAEVVREANLLFGPDGPSPDLASRQATLEAGGGALFQRLKRLDERLADLDSDFDRRLRQYIDDCGRALSEGERLGSRSSPLGRDRPGELNRD
jgi:hypothetical protein